MSRYINENFLLSSATAEQLFHEYAETAPILDYHCHLELQDIYENHHFPNLGAAWLGGDHYKWRIMRTSGIDEEYITGSADWRDKFIAFARALELSPGNPIHHWSHLELQRIFGINDVLTSANAGQIFDYTRIQLQDDSFRPRSLMQRFNVRGIFTIDAPTSDLRYHELLAADKDFNIAVLPVFRPDAYFEICRPDFAELMTTLGEAVGSTISSWADLCAALETRMEYFAVRGCRASDQSLSNFIFVDISEDETDALLKRALVGDSFTAIESAAWQSSMMLWFGRSYAARGWPMQLHLQCQRQINTRMTCLLGPNTGYDAIDDRNLVGEVAQLCDRLDQSRQLPPTIFFSLNMADMEPLAVMMGAFQDGSSRGKMQLGPAWWFLDNEFGIREQLKILARHGCLGTFIGMLTDSRSFMSYTRHEYFRRILCDLIGGWIESGYCPDDIDFYGGMIKDICYRNAREYFAL